MEHLLDELKSYADLAVHFDSQGFREQAVFYYTQTAHLIESHPWSSEGSSNQESFLSKAREYRQRATEIQQTLSAPTLPSAPGLVTNSFAFCYRFTAVNN